MQIPKDIIDPVMEFFNGDMKKTYDWMTADNPMLGGVSPHYMLQMGRGNRLRKFIDEAMEHNKEEKKDE